MSDIKGDRLLVSMSAAEVRRRLKGHGLGVRKIQSAGRDQALIIHTATGDHLRELRLLLGQSPLTSESDEKNGGEQVSTT